MAVLTVVYVVKYAAVAWTAAVHVVVDVLVCRELVGVVVV